MRIGRFGEMVEGSLEETMSTVPLAGGLTESALWGGINPLAVQCPAANSTARMRCICWKKEPT